MEDQKIINEKINDDQKDRVTVEEFLEKYDSLTSEKAKELYLESVICPSDYYVSYALKTVLARKILEIANFNQNDGSLRFDGVKQYQLYIWTILSVYTNLFLPENEFDIVFDILSKKKMLDKIVQKMPEDKKEFDIVFNMTRDDFIMNYNKTDYTKLFQQIRQEVLAVFDDILKQFLVSVNETQNEIKENSISTEGDIEISE